MGNVLSRCAPFLLSAPIVATILTNLNEECRRPVKPSLGPLLTFYAAAPPRAATRCRE